MGWKGQLVSEARNKRGHLIPVVGGLASQTLIHQGFQDAQASELGRLFHLGGAASSFVEVQVSSSLGSLAVFAGAFTSLQLEPHRFLKCCQLWRRFMQCGFGTSPGGNDETVCLVYSVESHVPEEDDTRNVDIRTVHASNASEPSLQAMARGE